MLETPKENPYAEIAEQLTALYAQKDAVAETMLARLAPLEARLAEAMAADPSAAVEAVLARLAPLEVQIEALRSAQATAEAGLVERLAALEGDGRQAEDAARAEAQAIATQLIAMRAAAAQTELFADRIALLEASLPRLSASQSLMMQAPEYQAERQAPVGAPVSAAAPVATREQAPEPAAELEPEPEPVASPLEAFRGLPRIVSLHQK